MRSKLNGYFKSYRYIILNIDVQSILMLISRKIGRAEVWTLLNNYFRFVKKRKE